MIAVFLNNLVPYHHARWNAYASLYASNCLLIEITSRDAFSVLEMPAEQSGKCRRHALFPGVSFDEIDRSALRKAVYQVLDEHRPKVVCLNGYSFLYNWVALDWCLKNRIPAIVCSESSEFDESRKPWKEAVKRFFVRRCAAGLAGGQPQAQYLVKLGLEPERVFTGYDVVDNEHFAAGATVARAQADEVRRKLALPDNYFLACSRFGQKKNLPLLIKAYARYRQLASTPETQKEGMRIWDLVLVGDGEERPLIEKAMVENGVGAFIHLAGAKTYTQLPDYYGLASAFIHASTTEQWGLVVNEAMASGLPVLVSNRCGCASDLVREGANGFTFDPSDVESIAQKMFQISNNVAALSSLGNASREIIANWSPEKFARGMSQAVNVAMARSPSFAKWLDRWFIWIRTHR